MRTKKTEGAFGKAFEDWAAKLRDLLEAVLGDLYSPPVSGGDEVIVKTLLGQTIEGEILETTPAGIVVAEPNTTDREIFISANTIDSMQIYRVEDTEVTADDEEVTDVRPRTVADETPAADEGPKDA